ncbi:YbjN domain-containing protein [Solwaraspora sp. WMMD406]|uniref:YbjN domain-containing protein n=1 Tax=Solwaraspora sp. WMMD406 TaxID=3016095 RepID=UPI0024170670|nr:YbjN domain-containing protein [Solwaraspora sp. WMMD406]MDG4764563.1 YbjN domain-containing protein [Solwaraspora sp. WMMD406]
MPWWSWRSGHTGGGEPDSRSRSGGDGSVRLGPPAPRTPEQASRSSTELSPARSPVLPCQPAPSAAGQAVNRNGSSQVAPVTLRRIGEALDLLDVRYLADGDGSLLAMWERHAVLFTLEGPDDEILVVRARPHSTVPPDWADRAYRVVNEWNHTRRFCKAYVGDPTDRGQLPIYAELQVPLAAGAHDALLVEVLDCGAAVATTFVDWLHDEGALL